MVDVSTVFSIEIKVVPDQDQTLVVGVLPDIDDVVRTELRNLFGARILGDGSSFQVKMRYANTIFSKYRSRGTVKFVPADPQVPLLEILNEATRVAIARADWPIASIEVVSEEIDSAFKDDFRDLRLTATCSVRVTQVKP
jgi:hypothetical protein